MFYHIIPFNAPHVFGYFLYYQKSKAMNELSSTRQNRYNIIKVSDLSAFSGIWLSCVIGKINETYKIEQ